MLREGSGNGDVARRGDRPRSVLDSSGLRDLEVAALDVLRDLLRPLDTSWSAARWAASRRTSPASVRGDIVSPCAVVPKVLREDNIAALNCRV